MNYLSTDRRKISADKTASYEATPTRTPFASLRAVTLHPLPVLTLAVVVITFIGAVLQTIYPVLLRQLWRDPYALIHGGQWWRLFSPLLVEDGNHWWHFLYVAIGFVIVGSVVEREAGRMRWLLLFMFSALVGELAGYLWQPYGAGSSVALCGLIAGLAIRQISQDKLHNVASIYTVGLVVILACEDVISLFITNQLIGIGIIIALCWLTTTILLRLHKQATHHQISAYYVVAIVLLGALVLIALHDIHGTALLAGLCLAALLSWRDKLQFRSPLSTL